MAKIISEKEFTAEVMNSEVPVVVDFFATWCGPCKMIAPALEELASELAGKAKVVKLDIDKDPELANRYNVRSVPTLMFFKGGNVVDQVIGAVPKQALAARISAIL